MESGGSKMKVDIVSGRAIHFTNRQETLLLIVKSEIRDKTWDFRSYARIDIPNMHIMRTA